MTIDELARRAQESNPKSAVTVKGERWTFFYPCRWLWDGSEVVITHGCCEELHHS